MCLSPRAYHASESCLSISLSINPPYFFLASSKFYYHFSIYSSRFFPHPLLEKTLFLIPFSMTLFFFLFRALPFQTLILAYISSLRQQFHGIFFFISRFLNLNISAFFLLNHLLQIFLLLCSALRFQLKAYHRYLMTVEPLPKR